MTSVWRQEHTFRLRGDDLLQKIGGGISQTIAAEFWEAGGASAATGVIVESQDLQAEALAGKETLQGAVVEGQDEQAEVLAGKETLRGTVAESQDEQAEVLAGKETLTGTIVEAQDEQAEALAGSHVFNAAVVEAQDEQTESLAGKETLFGIVAEPQDEQAEALAGEQVVGAIAVVAEAQVRQGEVLAGKQALPAAVGAHGWVGGEFKKPKEKKRRERVEIVQPLPQPILGAAASEQSRQVDNGGAIASLGARGGGSQARTTTRATGNLSLLGKGNARMRRPSNREWIRARGEFALYAARIAAREAEIQNLREEEELLILIA